MCTVCSKPKFRDLRRLCFACDQARDHDMKLALSAKLRMETAPEWVKQGSLADQRKWLGVSDTYPLCYDGAREDIDESELVDLSLVDDGEEDSHAVGARSCPADVA